jgi:hypothetical protein
MNLVTNQRRKDTVMIGCILATVGVIGLMKVAHCRRYGGGCGGGWRRRWGGHHHHHGHHHGFEDDDFGPSVGGGFGPRFILRGVMDRLETTPSQERVILAAADEFRQAASRLRDEGRRSRADVASAFRKPSFDEVMMGELFARHDTSIEELRKAFVGFSAKVHDALDERQRARLADMIESGPRFFRHGPFGGFARHGFDRSHWGW